MTRKLAYIEQQARTPPSHSAIEPESPSDRMRVVSKSRDSIPFPSVVRNRAASSSQAEMNTSGMPLMLGTRLVVFYEKPGHHLTARQLPVPSSMIWPGPSLA